MIFAFRIAQANLKSGFQHFLNAVAIKFWVTRGVHNYKEIVYYKYNKVLIAIENYDDLKILAKKRRNCNVKLYMTFIPEHSASIDKGIMHDIPFHRTIKCNGCGIQPIIGTLYKCFECRNFHLCEVCETDNHTQHMMIFENRSQINSISITDELIAAKHCDLCGREPIFGFRYKCIFCNKRIFCKYCAMNNPLLCKDHTGDTAAETVVAMANVPSVEDRPFNILNKKMNQMMQAMTLMESKILTIEKSPAMGQN